MASTTSMETRTGRRTVVGVFDGPANAERALNGLRDAGFSPDNVSVVAKDTSETKEMVEHTGMGGAEGAGTGAVMGGITGGLLGWLVGIGALLIPGVGPVIAAGALATTLGGAAIGAVTGGLIGALVDLGIPKEEAQGYEESVRQGRILLTVHAPDDQKAQDARVLFDRLGGTDVRAYGLSETITGTTAATTTMTGTTPRGSSVTGNEASGMTSRGGTTSEVITSEDMRDTSTRNRPSS